MKNAWWSVGLLLVVLVFVWWSYQSIGEGSGNMATKQLTNGFNETKNNMSKLTLNSPAFDNGGEIPAKYTCDGEETSPPLTISGAPKEADSLVLVMYDPDIPEAVKKAVGIEKYDHWLLYNLPADTTEIPEGTKRSDGLTSAGTTTYVGPCPPPQYEPAEHRYVFRLYAIKGQLNFPETPTLGEVEKAVQKTVLDKAELVGRYSRANE